MKIWLSRPQRRQSSDTARLRPRGLRLEGCRFWGCWLREGLPRNTRCITRLGQLEVQGRDVRTKGELVHARLLSVAMVGKLEGAFRRDPSDRIEAGFLAFCVHARLRSETLCASHASTSSTSPGGPATDSSRCPPISTRRRDRRGCC